MLVLVGLSAHHLSRNDTANAERDRAPANSASVSAAPSTYDVLHDRPRGAVAAWHVLTTATPETWSGVFWHAAATRVMPGWSLIGDIGSAGAAVAASGPPSSRAPPAA
ncbi:hypothetical protein [Lentzea pudingi]|uniref:hypothetical protein n=1 Tax=Lentzea pudingi TaxID=1789439 RepID=UPI00166A2C5F|nr:hypothetical protein [Lentzea pudingi]